MMKQEAVMGRISLDTSTIKHEKPQSGKRIFLPRFEPSSYLVQISCVTPAVICFV
jgi:hypothetical protein